MWQGNVNTGAALSSLLRNEAYSNIRTGVGNNTISNSLNSLVPLQSTIYQAELDPYGAFTASFARGALARKRGRPIPEDLDTAEAFAENVALQKLAQREELKKRLRTIPSSTYSAEAAAHDLETGIALPWQPTGTTTRIGADASLPFNHPNAFAQWLQPQNLPLAGRIPVNPGRSSLHAPRVFQVPPAPAAAAGRPRRVRGVALAPGAAAAAAPGAPAAAPLAAALAAARGGLRRVPPAVGGPGVAIPLPGAPAAPARARAARARVPAPPAPAPGVVPPAPPAPAPGVVTPALAPLLAALFPAAAAATPPAVAPTTPAPARTTPAAAPKTPAPARTTTAAAATTPAPTPPRAPLGAWSVGAPMLAPPPTPPPVPLPVAPSTLPLGPQPNSRGGVSMPGPTSGNPTTPGGSKPAAHASPTTTTPRGKHAAHASPTTTTPRGKPAAHGKSAAHGKPAAHGKSAASAHPGGHHEERKGVTTRSQSAAHRHGSGLPLRPKQVRKFAYRWVPFGQFQLRLDALLRPKAGHAPSVSLRYARTGQRIRDLPMRNATPALRKLLISLCRDPNKRISPHELDADELQWLEYALLRADMDASVLGYQPPNPRKQQEQQLQIVIGEIESGNDNPELVKEAKSLIQNLYLQGKMKRSRRDKLLRMFE